MPLGWTPQPKDVPWVQPTAVKVSSAVPLGWEPRGVPSEWAPAVEVSSTMLLGCKLEEVPSEWAPAEEVSSEVNSAAPSMEELSAAVLVSMVPAAKTSMVPWAIPLGWKPDRLPMASAYLQA